MCFNQTGDIFTLNSSSLKLVDKFTFIGSVSSIETDIDTWLVRHGQLSIDYRSYGSQTWPIKWNSVSSKQRSCRYFYIDALMDANWTDGRKSLTATTQECCEKYWTSPPNKAAAIRPPTTHHENYRNLTNQTCRTLMEKLGRAHKWCTPVDPFT